MSLYPGPQGQAIREALTDRIETEPVRFQARARVAKGYPTWVYYYDYVGQGEARNADGCRGAPHATEIPYIFGTLGTTPFSNMPPQAITKADRRLSQRMMRYWLAFARTGNPNAPGLPAWPSYATAGAPVLNFTGKTPIAVRDFRASQLDWIESKLTKPSVW